MEIPHKFDDLVADPSLLRKVLADLGKSKDEDHLLYFTGCYLDNKKPTDVFVGQGAMQFVSQRIQHSVARWVSGGKISQDVFQQKIGAPIELFVGIPKEAFPVDHPIRVNQLLYRVNEYQKYQQCKETLQQVPGLCFKEQVDQHQFFLVGLCEKGALRGTPIRHVPKIPHLHRSYISETIEELMKYFMPGFRVAYDVYGNLWISVQTLLGLITGKYALHKSWVEQHVFSPHVLPYDNHNPSKICDDLLRQSKEKIALLAAEQIHAQIVDFPITSAEPNFHQDKDRFLTVWLDGRWREDPM